MAVRMLYTRYARSHDKTGLSIAANVAAPSYRESETANGQDTRADNKHHATTITTSALSAELNSSMVIFPQYIARKTTTLTIREVSFPQLSDSFTVSNSSEDLFFVHRERPTIGWRQTISDAKTKTPVLSLKRNIGQLPISYSCLDLNNTKVLDLQGKFYWPYSGAKSTGFLLSAETGQKTELSITGSYRNRYATIMDVATGNVLVSVESNIFEARNIVGGRRTYTVTITAGVDQATAVAIVIALDARAD